jgi:SWI/SNF-related matrix-associated actin-dependent regulator 1 of chromatin subfamily A
MLLRMRDAISKLMEKCEKITKKMASLVQDLTEDSGVTEQPSNIPDHLMLAKYQMIGLNWLVLMHKQSLNGILADEMGLGKTIQAISFLAHLKELGDEGPHLIIVPSSTMDNWQKEFKTWCPSMKVLNYYGSQDERRHMRVQIVQEQVEFDVILTTYNMVISSPEDRVLFRRIDFHYVVYDEAHMLKNMATARYENLMRVKASRKLLLTGTPMQNNLVELMSLLVFVMPEMFANKKDQLKKMFSMFPVSLCYVRL